MAFAIPRDRPITLGTRRDFALAPDPFVSVGEALRSALERIPVDGILDTETGEVAAAGKPGAPS